MNTHAADIAKRFLHTGFESLSAREQRVLQLFQKRAHIARNINREFDEQLSFGQRLADSVAAFGGSWTFIIIFVGILVGWVGLNSYILLHRGAPFDPFPYILLNLVLSMVAALQAPVIMMSQNRQASKDRMDAAHDYEVNLKAELEIMHLHEKLDEFRDQQWRELVALQNRQIEMLSRLLEARLADSRPEETGRN